MSEQREELLEMPTIINFDPTVNDKAERIYKLNLALEWWIDRRDIANDDQQPELEAITENIRKEIVFTQNELDAIWRRAKQQ